ncbi:MAG: fluoride efflux transporter CrcB [Gemmatimonadaceae bacterium]
MLLFAIFLGAGLGGLSRYALGSWIQAATGTQFPWGTLAINVAGSLGLTFLYALLDSTMARPKWRAFLEIGFLGGFTTFSAFTYEAIRLGQDGEWARASLYVGGNVFVSLGTGVLGFRLASELLCRG